MKIYMAVIIVALMALLIGLQVLERVRERAATTKDSVDLIAPPVEVGEAQRDMGERIPWAASSETAAEPEQAIESSENAITATAILTRADGSQLELTAIDREFERISLLPGETVRLQVALISAAPGHAFTVETGHGGNINGTRGLAAVTPRNGRIEFTFSAGGHRGKYPVFIYQGNRQEVLDFFVGDEAPTGQAGPARFFNNKNS